MFCGRGWTVFVLVFGFVVPVYGAPPASRPVAKRQKPRAQKAKAAQETRGTGAKVSSKGTALKRVEQALREVKQMREQLRRKEQQLKALQKQLGGAKPGQRPKPRQRAPASRQPPVRPVRRAPPARRTPGPSKEPTDKPPSRRELDALRDAFRKAPTQPSQPTQPTPSQPAPQGGRSFMQQLANAMNPAVSALGIFAGGYTTGGNGHCHADGKCFGNVGIFGHSHDPIRTGLNLQQVELALQATVDPYFTAMVVLAFGEGEGVGELEIEEAYMETTSLPWGFQIKMGKFLSDLTRLGSKHLHDLDFATISLPLMLIAGGELFHYAAQITWLAPLPFYLRLGFEISYGGSIAYPIQDPSLPVLMGHIRTYFEPSDSVRLLFGGAVSYGIWDRQEADASDLGRLIASGHVLLQWRPPSRGRFLSFRMLLEYYANGSQCDPRKVDTSRPSQRQYCVGADPNQVSMQWLHGLTGKAILRFAQQWQTGVRVDWMQQREPSDVRPTHRLTAMMVFVATEFSRIRLEYNIANPFDDNDIGHAVWLQFQFSIGAHGAHKF